MYIYNSILFVFYIIIAVILTIFIVWNTFRTKKLTEKIVGAIALIMFIMRILMIR